MPVNEAMQISSSKIILKLLSTHDLTSNGQEFHDCFMFVKCFHTSLRKAGVEQNAWTRDCLSDTWRFFYDEQLCISSHKQVNQWKLYGLRI
jgi:hypothetical protein